MAKMFIDEYYRTFDNNRQGLVSFFRDMSTISFEGTSIKGGANYVAKVSHMESAFPVRNLCRTHVFGCSCSKWVCQRPASIAS